MPPVLPPPSALRAYFGLNLLDALDDAHFPALLQGSKAPKSMAATTKTWPRALLGFPATTHFFFVPCFFGLLLPRASSLWPVAPLFALLFLVFRWRAWLRGVCVPARSGRLRRRTLRRGSFSALVLAASSRPHSARRWTRVLGGRTTERGRAHTQHPTRVPDARTGVLARPRTARERARRRRARREIARPP